MEDVQKEAPVPEDQAVEPADVSAAVDQGDTAEQEVAEQGAAEEEVLEEPEGVEVEVEVGQTLSRTQVISRLKAIVLELEGGSLVVEGVPVGELAESVDFELEYSEKGEEYELEIELKWR